MSTDRESIVSRRDVDRRSSNKEKSPLNQPIRGVPTTNGFDTTCNSRSKTLKMIQRNRKNRSKLINIPSCGEDLHVEEPKPQSDKRIEIKFPSFKPRPFQTHDRKLENFEPKIANPYHIPKLKRIFHHEKMVKQTKRKKEPLIMSEPHTICDIYGSYYEEIEGRPLRQFIDTKVYMNNIRDITLWRTNAAFAKERILQIDQQYAYESYRYSQSIRLYNKSKYNFIHFIKESYLSAKRMQKLAEEIYDEVACVNDKLEQYSFQYVKVRNEVDHMTFLFNNLSMYRRFLYSLSPLTWRKENDPMYFEETNSFDALVDMTNDSDFILPHNHSLLKFRHKLRPNKEAILYFKKPEELLEVFDELRMQCVTYVQIDVVTSKLIKAVGKSRTNLKMKLAKTIQDLKEWVISMENDILFLEEREIAYKEAFEKLLMSAFHKLWSSHENIKLFNCVQYVNLNLIGRPEDSKDSIATLMCDVEILYCDLNFKLDSLNQEVVRAAKNDMFKEDIKIMKRAHKAQRILTEYERLSKSLYVSFEPPRNKMKNTISSKKKQIVNERSK